MSWFGRFGGTSEGDDASPLLSTSKKPYRSWISANDISVFDFRIYLFARQAFMLFHLGRTAEIARRGAFFISTFARTLRQHQVGHSAVDFVAKHSPIAIRRHRLERTSANLGHFRRV